MTEQDLPRLKKITIEVWDCGIESHRHKRFEYAKNCFSIHGGRSVGLKQDREKRNRNVQMAIKVLNGASYKEVGLDWRLSGGVVKSAIFNTLFKAQEYAGRNVIDQWASIKEHRECKDQLIPILMAYAPEYCNGG